MNLMYVMLQQAGGANWSFFLMLADIFVVMYFFMIRPQNKKQKEIQNFRNSLQIGQNVVTAGGIYGTIKALNDAEGTVSLEVASNVKITVDKSMIYQNVAATQANAK